MKFLFFVLFSFLLFADTNILDPVLRPPQWDTSARPSCPSPSGCFGFNSQTKSFEGFDGTKWGSIGVIPTWTASTYYKEGTFLTAGADNNYLVKVVNSGTSTSSWTDDTNSGFLNFINPPITTTGVLTGGLGSIAGNIVTIQAGSGIIVDYESNISVLPIFKIISWPLSTITVSGTGIYTIIVDSTGALQSITGLPSLVQDVQNIRIGIADNDFGVFINAKTYPSDILNQLKELGTFFGIMFKDLKYTVLGTNQITKSAYTLYSWGTNTDNTNGHYSPSTKSIPAQSPMQFYEYTQNGAVTGTQVGTIRTSTYDNNGTLTALPNKAYGFIRFYIDVSGNDVVMYSQKTYTTQAEAETGAVADTFIVPTAINRINKYVGYVYTNESILSLAGRTVYVCPPFGCTLGGKSGGGGGTGGGDFFGAATSTADNLLSFSDSSGKIGKDSGVSSVNLVTKSSSSTDNAVAKFDLDTGKIIQNSGVIISDTNDISGVGDLRTTGDIVSAAYNMAAGVSINYSTAGVGNNAYTTASCGAFTLSGMADGGVYALAIKGTAQATCVFTYAGVTLHYPVGHGVTTVGKQTLYTFMRLADDIYIGWSTGL